MSYTVRILAMLVCLTLQGGIASGVGEEAFEIEELLGIRVGPLGIMFQVASYGCTAKEDFRVNVLESFPLQLQLIRLNPDLCEASPAYGRTIRFSYRELGLRSGDQFVVINPHAVVTVGGK